MDVLGLDLCQALSGIEGAMKMAMKCKEIFQELGDRRGFQIFL